MRERFNNPNLIKDSGVSKSRAKMEAPDSWESNKTKIGDEHKV